MKKNANSEQSIEGTKDAYKRERMIKKIRGKKKESNSTRDGMLKMEREVCSVHTTSLYAMKNFLFGKSLKCDKGKLPAIFIITTYDG